MNWITKTRQRMSSSNCDVSVTKAKTGALVITFKNNSYNKITSTGFIIAGFDDNKNRLYFGSSNRYEGFKLTSFSNNNSKCSFKFKCDLQFEIGDYNLEYDKEILCYYIDKNRRLK